MIHLILRKLSQGPAVMIDRRRHPLRRSPIIHDDRPCHSKVTGQTTSLQIWSGHTRRYAAEKLGSNVEVLATKDP